MFDARAITGAATKISVVGTEPSKIVVNYVILNNRLNSGNMKQKPKQSDFI